MASTVLELAQWRKTGDLGPLPPKLRIDVALHCMSLALRMQQRMDYKFRGWRFIFSPCYRKYRRKYLAMYSFYDGYVDESLKRVIRQINANIIDLLNEARMRRVH